MRIFSNAATAIRLVGSVLIDLDHDWIAGNRRYLSEESMALLNTTMDTGDHAAIDSGERCSPSPRRARSAGA